MTQNQLHNYYLDTVFAHKVSYNSKPKYVKDYSILRAWHKRVKALNIHDELAGTPITNNNTTSSTIREFIGQNTFQTKSHMRQ